MLRGGHGGKIFINYRRALNLKEAELLEQALQQRFGKSRVFLDTSGIEEGEEWLHKLEAQVDASDAMVALIGLGWAAAPDGNGGRRLDNPDDFVRIEIARRFPARFRCCPCSSTAPPCPMCRNCQKPAPAAFYPGDPVPLRKRQGR